jgi:hypothetical protein
VKKYLYIIYKFFVYSFGHPKQYFFDGEKKNPITIFSDLIKWYLREGKFNDMYFAMGLGFKHNHVRNFFGRKTFLRIKNNAESYMKLNANCGELSFDAITKDKFYASSILLANSIPVIPIEALICNGEIINQRGELCSLNNLLQDEKEFIIKSIALEAGEGVMVCQKVGNQFIINGKEFIGRELEKELGNGIFILQKKYTSHKAIRKINDSALNTTRIVTIRNGKDIIYLTGFQSFATGGATIDSWSDGSVYAGVDIENSCLKKYAITSLSDKRPGLLDVHPDSNVVFESYKIPYLMESVELCLKAHRLFYFNFAIGWDVAITDKGPVIVEANEKPGMNVVQCVDGGLYQQVKECYQNLTKGKNQD